MSLKNTTPPEGFIYFERVISSPNGESKLFVKGFTNTKWFYFQSDIEEYINFCNAKKLRMSFEFDIKNGIVCELSLFNQVQING